MATLVPVRKQEQKKGYPGYLYKKREIIKRKSILDVCTHLKNTKWKEIFQYEHFFTNSSLGIKNNLLIN